MAILARAGVSSTAIGCRRARSVLAAAGALAVWMAWAPPVGAESVAAAPSARWWAPADGRPLPPRLDYPNEHGIGGVLFEATPLGAAAEPFFAPLGSNGRACVSCHQPADAMGLSLASVRERWAYTHGGDPLFAAVDGADCPTALRGAAAGHRLMLSRALVRIERPWPPRDARGRVVEPEFTLAVVADPTGCNTGDLRGLGAASPAISVYRRPRVVANLRAAERAGTLLTDARYATLAAQAADAARTHLQRAAPVPDEILAAIVRFERTTYAAQVVHPTAGSLGDAGARGGPEPLAQAAGPIVRQRDLGGLYTGWLDSRGGTRATRGARHSVARGAALFATRRFDLSGTAGLPPGVGPQGSCASCHDEPLAGGSRSGLETDIGTSNQPHAPAGPDLPLFRLTCHAGRVPHETLGAVVLTHDPGLALTTGRCVDIGRMVPQSLRGLAARAPYFANGGAATLGEVVEFYERRYRIGLSEREKADLVAFLAAL